MDTRSGWLPTKMMAGAFLFMMTMVILAPHPALQDAAMIVMVVFAVALNCSIVLPLANIIIQWNSDDPQTV